jgi:hypothetical protein
MKLELVRDGEKGEKEKLISSFITFEFLSTSENTVPLEKGALQNQRKNSLIQYRMKREWKWACK